MKKVLLLLVLLMPMAVSARTCTKCHGSGQMKVFHGMATYGVKKDKKKYAHQALEIDSTQHYVYTNLAAALLFQGKYTEAEMIYRQYKSELKDSFLEDFKQFAEAGVIPKEYEADVENIKRILNE